MIEVKDMLGNELNIGDTIVYASKPYSGVKLSKGIIREIVIGSDYHGRAIAKLKLNKPVTWGTRTYNHKVTVTKLDRVAKVAGAPVSGN